ncbi:hypothetical protein BFR04_09035 [Gaetbulibacter sp. 4G1]|nr:hypothetical protein [Gaetbulibacter sp. 4G1]PIA77574.1 hypothetical protein BFR04_09035 [Gaetbulibacter sp. 4G1]
MKKTIFFLIVLALTTSSCIEMLQKAGEGLNSTPATTSESNYKTVGIDSLFEIDIPIYMKPLPELNPEAILQYANIYKETYFVVITENKEEYIDLFKRYGEFDNKLPVIENYKNAQKALFIESIDNARIQEYGLANINDYPARQIKIIGEVDGIKAAYIVAFIEGESDIFMLMNWTTDNRLTKFENSFEYINASFKLID